MARYRIAAAVFTVLAKFLALFAPVGLLGPWPRIHFSSGGEHYDFNLRWAGAWALLAALFAYVGRRHCLHRASIREPDDVDWLFWKVAAVLAWMALLAYLLIPRVHP